MKEKDMAAMCHCSSLGPGCTLGQVALKRALGDSEVQARGLAPVCG